MPWKCHRLAVHLRPVWASLWLLAWLLSATPLLPISTALVAWMEGNHRISVSADKDGIHVVLGHDARDPLTALTHSHRFASRALTLLAEPAGQEHSDHVLNFQSASVTMLRSPTPGAAVPSAAELSVAVAVPAAVTISRRVSTVEAPQIDLSPAATSVVVARATVFLI